MTTPTVPAKIIIFSAPSGSGKSTIISRLMADAGLRLTFSISATSRAPRGAEQDGREYYFLTSEEFARRAAAGAFIEWEEVYAGTCYGTPASELDRAAQAGCHLVMDIDVKGGINVKKQFGSDALAIFIQPPSLDELASRLRGRATDSPEAIEKRLAKAEYEMSFARQFDHVVVNDDLDAAVEQVRNLIHDFTAPAK